MVSYAFSWCSLNSPGQRPKGVLDPEQLILDTDIPVYWLQIQFTVSVTPDPPHCNGRLRANDAHSLGRGPWDPSERSERTLGRPKGPPGDPLERHKVSKWSPERPRGFSKAPEVPLLFSLNVPRAENTTKTNGFSMILCSPKGPQIGPQNVPGSP